MKSLLTPEVSLGVGLATATVVYAVYQQATPTIADIRSVAPRDDNIEASRRMAAWSAAGLVSAISLLAKDPTVFMIGGGMVIVMDWWTRHANEVNPLTGKASMAPSGMAPTAVNNSDTTFEFAEGVGTY